ncbi:SDR family oxidoreductase [Balneola sp. MJW-20]|uniref:SDR family oxidoreductase n=1 Tax=Gracilimonas aurantiaca TaxID=3234185 RepID=UPI0034675CF0
MNSFSSSSALIIGCGWTGKKLGKFLSEQGVQVTGTTRSKENFKEIRSFNIEPLLLDVSLNPASGLSIPDADTIFISLSPGRGDDRSDYPLVLARLASELQNKKAQIILFSSTSAYDRQKGIVTEKDAVPDAEADNVILKGEGVIKAQLKEAVILRFGGLYGPDRHPVKYLAGRKELKDGDAPVNLVHSDDIIRICAEIIKQEVRAGVFNVCADLHPSRKVLYTSIARKRGLSVPEFEDGGSDEKRVSNQKIKETLGYKFLHPDPMDD